MTSCWSEVARKSNLTFKNNEASGSLETQMIVPKTEYVEAGIDSRVESRPCPATFQGVIETMKELESQSKIKQSELESKLQDMTAENETLKASVAAKERDRALYYEKYQEQ